MNLSPGKATIGLGLNCVAPRPGGDDRIAADHAVRNWAVGCVVLAEINEVRSESGVHHGPKIGGSIVAVIKFLDGDDVRLESLKDTQCEGLITLNIAIQIGGHD